MEIFAPNFDMYMCEGAREGDCGRTSLGLVSDVV